MSVDSIDKHAFSELDDCNHCFVVFVIHQFAGPQRAFLSVD